jgi:hypothetical protein
MEIGEDDILNKKKKVVIRLLGGNVYFGRDPTFLFPHYIMI